MYHTWILWDSNGTIWVIDHLLIRMHLQARYQLTYHKFTMNSTVSQSQVLLVEIPILLSSISSFMLHQQLLLVKPPFHWLNLFFSVFGKASIFRIQRCHGKTSLRQGTRSPNSSGRPSRSKIIFVNLIDHLLGMITRREWQVTGAFLGNRMIMLLKCCLID